jgi:hypothetical protein
MCSYCLVFDAYKHKKPGIPDIKGLPGFGPVTDCKIAEILLK